MTSVEAEKILKPECTRPKSVGKKPLLKQALTDLHCIRIVALITFLLPFWAESVFCMNELSVDEALKAILDRSLKAAEENVKVEAASAQKLKAYGAFTPSLSLETGRTISQEGYRLATSTSSIQAVTRLNLFRFGAHWKSLQAAQAREDTARANYLDILLREEENAVRLIFSQIVNTKWIKLHQKQMNNRKQLLEIAERRYQRGLLPLEEVNRLTIDLENARAILRDLETSEIKSRSELTEALGHSLISSQWPWQDLLRQFEFSKSDPLDFTRLPVWQAAHSVLEAETHSVSQRLRLLLPTLEASFSYGTIKTGSISDTGWVAGLTLSIPLFNQFQDYGDYLIERTKKRQAELELEQVERRSIMRRNLAVESLELSILSAKERDHTLSQSTSMLEDAIRRFEAGFRKANDLALDQNRFYDSELSSIRGWSSAHLAYVAYCHVYGFRVRDCQGLAHEN